METRTIYVVRQATFTINGEDRTNTSEIVVAAYTKLEDAQERMKRLADKYEQKHYMVIFNREVEARNMITLVSGSFGAAFGVNETALYE